MNKNEKTRPVAATTKRAMVEETAAFGGAAASFYNNSTTQKRSRQVSDFLPIGAENAVSGSKIAESLGLELRDVTRQIERERQRGVAICAAVAGNERGYFLAQNAGELALYIRSLNRRIKNVQKTLRALDSTLADMCGQQEIEWGDE